MNTDSILSRKLTSELITKFYYAGFYDKITLDARPLNINKNQIKKRLDQLGIFCEDGSFRGGGTRLAIKTFNDDLILARYNYSTKIISQFILNPSSYSNYNEFIQDVSIYLVDIEKLESLRIIRLDKTVDYSLDINTLVAGLSIKNKRAIKGYEFRSGRLEGFELGKYPEVAKVYNRQKKAKLSVPCTRIEFCCQRNKIEFENLGEMKNKWLSDYFDKTFECIKLSEITIKNEYILMPNRKIKELKTFLSKVPYFFTKTILNKNRNFNRDYLPYLNIEEWAAQPTLIFNTGVRSFFKSNATEGIV
ncbi:hypothetical protein ACRXCV_15675 [Halobacteriovorax sp. GFR7]|uniref:hypothetical protein n=1 Tax=unclassified Halobacteriovorax TaxID=2639665 RepID=UPI003D958A5D